MCGRTCINLCQADILHACAYKKDNESKFSKPKWDPEDNLGKRYCPSSNIAPTDITPVLTANPNGNEGYDRIVKPMMWGMVPPWHKGSYKTHGLTTNNCRIETILTSKLYSQPLIQGKRCIILAEGFYEWQTVNKTKQPYYIFSPRNDPIMMYKSEPILDIYSDTAGWKGIDLLKMAGLYNTWACDDGILYSYSIITMESNSAMDWIHHRMPAILETDEQISDWLDFDRVSYKDAVEILTPAKSVSSYTVSNLVNNSRNKSEDCNKPGSLNDKPVKNKDCGSSNLMAMWLKSQGAKATSNVAQMKRKIDEID